VLDQLIEKFSPTRNARWEHAWEAGRLPAPNACASSREHARHARGAAGFPVAGSHRPAFSHRRLGAHADVSTSSATASCRSSTTSCSTMASTLPVYANDIGFSGDRLIRPFRFTMLLARSANAKAHHLAPYGDHRNVFTATAIRTSDRRWRRTCVHQSTLAGTSMRSPSPTIVRYLEPYLKHLQAGFERRRSGSLRLREGLFSDRRLWECSAVVLEARHQNDSTGITKPAPACAETSADHHHASGFCVSARCRWIAPLAAGRARQAALSS